MIDKRQYMKKAIISVISAIAVTTVQIPITAKPISVYEENETEQGESGQQQDCGIQASGDSEDFSWASLRNPITKDGVSTWDCIWFGEYWQNKDSNGDGAVDRKDEKEPIKWRILSIDDVGNALLLSDRLLEDQQYNTLYEDVSWDNCTLRSFLNCYDASYNLRKEDYSTNGFLCNAFTEEERKAITISSLRNEDNSVYGTIGGKDTQDKVFSLSLKEVLNPQYGFINNEYSNTHYTDTDKTRVAKVTKCIIDASGLDLPNDDEEPWGLRSPGLNKKSFSVVSYEGRVDASGCVVDLDSVGIRVRPALRLNLSSNDSLWGYAGSVCSKGIEIDEKSFDSGIDELLNHTNPDEYNPDLAYMLMALADAAYDEDKIQTAYKNLEFSAVEFNNYYENPFDLRYGVHNVAYTIGQKKQKNGNGDILLISIRGSYSGKGKGINLLAPDWQSDFTLGNPSPFAPSGIRVHYGFGIACDNLCNSLKEFIDKHELNDNTQIVVTGHSRGAAVANLLEARIMDGSLKSSGVNIPSKATVYGYNFACPDTMIFDLGDYSNEYDNIFNIANGLDPVSFVAGIIGDSVIERFVFPKGYWGKYGKSYWFAEDNNWKKVFESEKYIDGEAHDPGRYLTYLSNVNNNGLDVFKDRISIAGGTEKKLAPIALAFFVCCPADVTVTDEGGTKLASVSEKGVEYFTSDNPELFAFSYGDKKAFYYFGNKKLKVHMTGTDSGSMEYKIANVDIVSKEIDKEKSFANVNLFEGKIMESEVSVDDDIDDAKLFQTDSNNNVISEITTEGEEINIYTIDSNAETGGKITPSGAVYVNEGKSQKFDITADEGYVIKDVRVDNVSVGALSSYTFTDVTSNHSITASFEKADSDNSEKLEKNDEDLLIPINTQYKATVDVKNVMLQYFTKHNPDAVVKKIKFKSSNKKVVKVNKKGIAKGGKQSGTATITMYVKTLETVTKPNGKQKKKLSKWTVAGELTVNNKGK